MPLGIVSLVYIFDVVVTKQREVIYCLFVCEWWCISHDCGVVLPTDGNFSCFPKWFPNSGSNPVVCGEMVSIV